MPDVAPNGGPFDQWPLADRVAWLAESIDLHVVDGEAPEPYVLAEYAAQLRAIADELGAVGSGPVTVLALCSVRNRGANAASCDRPDGHRGEHSWQADRLRFLLRDYETQVLVDLPAIRRDLADVSERERKQAKELAAWEAKPIWRPRPKPDRG